MWDRKANDIRCVIMYNTFRQEEKITTKTKSHVFDAESRFPLATYSLVRYLLVYIERIHSRDQISISSWFHRKRRSVA